MTTDHSAPVERVLDRLESYKQRGEEFRARCPAHDGNSEDSLTVKEGDDGRALIICRAGCEFEEVVDALGLKAADLFPHNGYVAGYVAGYAPAGPAKAAKKAASKREAKTFDELPDGTYFEFESPSGEVLYIQRHKKEYYRKAGEDQWTNGLDGVGRVLYRLPELMDGVRAGKTVYHLEGPKDAETARERLGVVATTSGASDSWRAEFRAFYTGADVVVVPDNDEPGRKEDPWAASVLRYNAANAQAILEEKLGHARAMRRSHTATFHILIKKWDREISWLEALLGINRHARKKAS